MRSFCFIDIICCISLKTEPARILYHKSIPTLSVPQVHPNPISRRASQRACQLSLCTAPPLSAMSKKSGPSKVSGPSVAAPPLPASRSPSGSRSRSGSVRPLSDDGDIQHTHAQHDEHQQGGEDDYDDEDDAGSVSGSESGSGSGSGSDNSSDAGSDFEGHSGYKKGGYHPVHIGDVYGPGGRYTIERKLGWGHFSTVWLASDATKPADHPAKLVALKIQKSAIQYTEAALDEITLLEEINVEYQKFIKQNKGEANTGKGGAGAAAAAAASSSSSSADSARATAAASPTSSGLESEGKFIVHLLDHFTLLGPHGKHQCLVFERAGKNLLHVIKKFNYQGLPLPMVKSMIRQILHGLHFLHHNCHIIHTDLKPENFLIQGPEYNLAELQKEREEAVKARLEKENAKRQAQKLAEIEALRASMGAIKLGPSSSSSASATAAAASAAASATGAPKLTKNQKKRLKAKKKKQAEKAAGGGAGAAADKKDGGAGDNDDEDGEDEDGEDEKEESEAAATAAAAAAPAEASAGTAAPSADVATAVAAAAPGSTSDDASTAATAAADATAAASAAAAAPATPAVDHLDSLISSFLSGESAEFHTKIADLGNACWTHKHFTDDVTTRQYRAPEVLVGYPYSTPIDIFSTAALAFELITGEYLFDPKHDEHNKFTRDEDHLALMSELLGRMPKKLTTQGKYSRDLFTKRGDLRHIKELDRWGLYEVLRDKYHLGATESKMLASFLLPMLHLDPDRRATAQEALSHPWLRLQTEEEYLEYFAAEEAAKEAARSPQVKQMSKKARKQMMARAAMAGANQPAGTSSKPANDADPDASFEADDLDESFEGAEGEDDDGSSDGAVDDDLPLMGDNPDDPDDLGEDLGEEDLEDDDEVDGSDEDGERDPLDDSLTDSVIDDSQLDDGEEPLMYQTESGFSIRIPPSLQHRPDLQYLFAQATERALSGDSRFAAFLDPLVGESAILEAAREEEEAKLREGEEGDAEEEEQERIEREEQELLEGELDELDESALADNGLDDSTEGGPAAAALRQSQLRYLRELRLRAARQDALDAELDADLARQQQLLDSSYEFNESEEQAMARSHGHSNSTGSATSASAAHAALHPHSGHASHHHVAEHAPSRHAPHSTHALVHHRQEQTQAAASSAAAANHTHHKPSTRLAPVHGSAASRVATAPFDASPSLADVEDLGVETPSTLRGELDDDALAMAAALNSHSHLSPFVSASSVDSSHANDVDAERALEVASSSVANPLDVRQLAQLLKTNANGSNSKQRSVGKAATAAAPPTMPDEPDEDDLQLAREEAAAEAASAAAASR